MRSPADPALYAIGAGVQLDERCVMEHDSEIDSTELARHQAVADLLLSLFVATAVEAFDDGDLAEHFQPRRRRFVALRRGIVLCQVGSPRFGTARRHPLVRPGGPATAPFSV